MRLTRKLGIVLGLALGWWAAGHFAPVMTLAVTENATQEHSEGSEPEHAENTHGQHADTEHASEGHEGTGDGHEAGHGVSDAAAERLVPAENPGWFAPVATGIIVLFVLAGLVGTAALLIKGPDQPDPAEEHHH